MKMVFAKDVAAMNWLVMRRPAEVWGGRVTTRERCLLKQSAEIGLCVSSFFDYGCFSLRLFSFACVDGKTEAFVQLASLCLLCCA